MLLDRRLPDGDGIGAIGLVLKSCLIDDLVAGIRSVAAGENVIDRDLLPEEGGDRSASASSRGI